jgi:hypothetical protein
MRHTKQYINPASGTLLSEAIGMIGTEPIEETQDSALVMKVLPSVLNSGAKDPLGRSLEYFARHK